MFKSFLTLPHVIWGQSLPSFLLGAREASSWQLFGLRDLFGNVCERCVPVHTSLLGGCGKRAAQKNAAQLFSWPSFSNSITEQGVSSEAALTLSAVGSRVLVLGLVAPRSCALMQELHISLHELKPVTIAVTFSAHPRRRRPVPWAGALLLPCQTARLP